MADASDIDAPVLVQLDRYRRVCRLDCVIVRGSHDIVVRCWSEVGAVVMAPQVGAAVHARLTDPGPVILVEDGVWIMLTAPIPNEVRALWKSGLTAADSAIVAADAVVKLPGPRTPGRWWFVAPLSGDRPPPELVFAEIARFRRPAADAVSAATGPAWRPASTREVDRLRPVGCQGWVSAELLISRADPGRWTPRSRTSSTPSRDSIGDPTGLTGSPDTGAIAGDLTSTPRPPRSGRNPCPTPPR